MAVEQGRRRAARPARPATAVFADAVRAVDQDAAVEGAPLRWSRTLFWLPLVGTVLLTLPYVLHRSWFYWLLREDHPVEWGQFAFCAFASLMSAVVSVRLARRGHRGLAVLLLLVAFGALVLAGEEISWGQRVFGWATPSTLAADNRQHETNLHNLDAGIGFSADAVSKLVELMMGIGGVLLGLLARPARSVLNRSPWWIVAPPLFALPGFGWMALYQGFMLGTGSTASPAIVFQEWVEFCFYLSIAITVGCCYVRAATGRYEIRYQRGLLVRRRVPGSRADLRQVFVVAVVVSVVTAVFAALTSRTGIVPGNVPGAPVGP
jgi:hypothetical protein